MFETITAIEEIGEVDTYDLEIDSPYHNYYANGICVSNSHSVSYGFIAMQTLYLKHYHPAEFYTALLNNAKGTGTKEEQQEWMENTIASAISKGLIVKPPSRSSQWICSITGENEITMGFSMINGFGEVAYQELTELVRMKGKELSTISRTAFFELPFSKFNKTAFESCLKAGVFDDWSNSREYLLALKTKKRKKIADPQQMTVFNMEEIEIGMRMDDTKYQATTAFQKLEQFIQVCGFDIEHIERIAKIKKSIAAKTSKTSESVDAFTNFHGDGTYYFFLNDIKYLKTKTNKDYLELSVGDGISKTKLRIFEPMMERIAPELERKAVYMTQFVQNEKGFKNIKRNAKFKKIVHAYGDEVIT
jgi:DNA polymerase III alpha subunit